ncbi:MAG: GNAT family N-acetyltransferase [Methylocystis sp.]|nr:MAG: GNAT family N-acetyltransferase [Methylocystis sp.]
MPDVFLSLEDSRRDWEELFSVATASPYQSFQFLSEWFDTIGREDGATPFVIVDRDEDGRPRCLIPLCVETHLGCRIATFLGGRESNFNLPLIRPDVSYDEARLRALLMKAAQRSDAAPDLFYFRNQPRRFEEFDNPLVFAASRPSASFAYGLTLPATAEALAGKFSKDARKKLRKKEARLAQVGELRYEHQPTGDRAQAIVEALIVQKSTRFSEMGVGNLFHKSGPKDLLRRTAANGAIELHALSVNGRIVATYAGLTRGGRFSAMLNSFDMDEEISRSSPGDLLLHALMRNLVERGFSNFDLGAGEARYKNAVCDETIELYDTMLPVSACGALAAPIFMNLLRLKRRIKQTPALARVFGRLRRLVKVAR